MARHPNQVSPYGPIRAKGSTPAKTEYMVRKETQERDLKALETLQAQRPAKPPVRR
jgi:hypothetical protein